MSTSVLTETMPEPVVEVPEVPVKPVTCEMDVQMDPIPDPKPIVREVIKEVIVRPKTPEQPARADAETQTAPPIGVFSLYGSPSMPSSPLAQRRL